MLKNNFQKGSASFKTIAGIAVIAVVVAIVSAYATIKMMTPNVLVAPVTTTDVTSKSTPAPSLTPTQTMIPDAVEGWKAYNNSKDGYEIKYPSDWIILSDWKSITTDKDMGINFCGPEYRSTAECSTGGKGNNPVITLRNDMPDINKAGYCSKNEASIFCDKSLILSQREAEIAGKTGIITEFKDMNDGSIRADWKKNSTDEKVYELTVVGLKKYANYREIFDKMLSTFKFTENDITADWQTYTKKDYGFSFKYPAEFVSADTNLRNETPDYLDRFGIMVNMLSLSKSSYSKNTDLSRADILVAVNRDVSGGEYFFQSVDKSKGVPPPELEKLSLKKKVVINGITWGMAEKEGAAAGTHSRTRVYHTFQNGNWYEVQLNLWTASDGSATPVNVNDIWNKLESVLPTFEFTK